ncbi:DsbA family protein [Natrinema halophilum]|uniref:DsbA family protein n=1 Tax=Natrinema halophilum TaxID=1699371 RepID=A0A7D5L3F6_9EURY|nr:DsbA family protein [Natrinema halophilum]QLG49565.1 DsbA family protein [Natrinema halophilum]
MSPTDTESDRPTITQFTDPMCTWCWGSEPIIRRLRTVFGDQIQVRYVMGGLIEDFEDFYDPANDISEPSEVAPHWVEASEQHGMPVDTEIFESDPAQSTYPASVAFVAARQQDTGLAHRYLRRLREAYTTQARNVNHREEQVQLAASVGLDVDAFTAALDDGTARNAFEDDLARTRTAGVRSFPTYHVSGPGGERRAPGFKSFDDLVSALMTVSTSLEPTSPPPMQDFIDEYGPVATREVAEVYELDDGNARQVLQSLVDDGLLRREPRGNGTFWHANDGGDD